MKDTIIDDIDRQLKEIEARRDALSDEFQSLLDARSATKFLSEEWYQADARLDAHITERRQLSKEAEALRARQREECEYLRTQFVRPTGGLANILNKWLGPLPPRTVMIHPTREALKEVRSYWLLAAITLVVAIASLLALVVCVPGMSLSVYSVLYGAVSSVVSNETLAFVLTLVMCLWAARRLGFTMYHSYQGKFWDGAAMLEEQWFRTGAESWSWRQRIYSCVTFGLVHVVNIIYPIASLLVVGMVGGVMMLVYLREYRRSGDTRLATLASTKFHASYNRLAVAYMVVALSITFGPSAFSFVSSLM